MSQTRRFAAALFGALLMQVIGLGMGVDCAASRAESAAGAAGADAHAAHREQADAPAHDQNRRDHAPAHCPMAMTCAPTALIVVAYAIDEPAATTTLIVVRDDAMPPSPGGAPEPPPPRA